MSDPICVSRAPALPSRRSLGDRLARSRRGTVALFALALLAALRTATPPAAAAPDAAPGLFAGAATDTLRSTFDDERAAAGPAAEAPRPAAVPLLPAFASLPPVEVRTVFVGLHVLGISFGLGGATMLDFWILRWMRWGHLPSEIVRTFGFVSKAVTAGLLLIWISGLGFLGLFAATAPEKLANPKVLAKVAIVLVLSANGWVVHRFLLPYLSRASDRPLFGGIGPAQRLALSASGAVSAVSWYAAFALGLLHEFNGKVPAATLLLAWLAAVCLLTLGIELAMRAFARRRAAPTSLRVDEAAVP